MGSDLSNTWRGDGEQAENKRHKGGGTFVVSDGSFVCDTTNCFAKSNGGAGAGGHAARREPVRWLTFVDDNLLGCPNLYTQKLFDSLVQDPNWTHGREVEVVIVEVAGNRGYNWHTLQA